MIVVRVTGPESSGKSTLARALAWCLDGIYVAEQARAYLHQRGGAYTLADLPLIWEAQRRAEDAARELRPNYVICDTGPEVVQIWAEVKYGRCPDTIQRATDARHYDLTFLCAPDLPWTDDPLREAPSLSARTKLHERYRKLLPSYHLIAGEDRTHRGMALLRRHAFESNDTRVGAD